MSDGATESALAGPARMAIMVALVRLLDAVAVAVAGWAAFVLRHGEMAPPPLYLAALVCGVLLALEFLAWHEAYAVAILDDLPRQMLRITAAWSLVVLALIALGFFAKVTDEMSRAWMMLWGLAAPAALTLHRGVVAGWLRHQRRLGRFNRRIIVVGSPSLAGWVAEHAARDRLVEVVGLHDPHGNGASNLAPPLASLDEVVATARRLDVEAIIVALPDEDEAALARLVGRLGMLPVTVYICPGRVNLPLEDRKVADIAGIPLLRVARPPLGAWGLLVKAIEDRVLALLLLPLLLPVMAMIAVAVRLDSPGPVLFRQPRGGFNGRVFTMYKFRTMVDRPETGEVVAASRDDARVTRLGRFLRRTSLDELPQIFNVLKGDMSMVGPRPHAVQHDALFAQALEHYPARLRVKPGITGWAQINGARGGIDGPDGLAQRIRYDLYYIENWSVLFDLQILALTLVKAHRNAY